jgi:hypothetical protein
MTCQRGIAFEGDVVQSRTHFGGGLSVFFATPFGFFPKISTTVENTVEKMAGQLRCSSITAFLLRFSGGEGPVCRLFGRSRMWQGKNGDLPAGFRGESPVQRSFSGNF